MSLQSTPFLLPQNRKLRHLRGIYIRNLTFAAQPRKYSIDDASIPPKPLAKLESLPRLSPSSAASVANAAIPHAHSSDDLRAEKSRSSNRRVTLSGATALVRQRILEQALENSTADAFFSLHCEGVEEPIYVSEVEEKSTNFNFRFFDLAEFDHFVTRASQLTIKVWTCRPGGVDTPLSAWNLLLEDDVDLRFLGCIGGSMQAERNTHFPPNSILFHLLDGVYMLGARVRVTQAGAKKKIHVPALPTSSYNALMRLANLENSLQDTLATRDKLAAQIDELVLAQASSGGDVQDEARDLPDAEERVRRVRRGLAHQRRLAETARHRRNDLVTSLQARRGAIAAGRALQQRAWADIENAAKKLAASRATVVSTQDGLRGQRRRICEDLQRIFAVGPVPLASQPLAFQICGLPLPNTEYGAALASSQQAASGSSPSPVVTEDSLSAALGYVAVLVGALQGYLGVALPYAVTPYGSRSVARDDISKNIPDPQRAFPLYLPRGGLSSQYRFDYAWFLLNKDIEALCYAQGLKVVDIRHTLPNLKYLLYVCSAGSEDLPERKKGGVRGLWMGHIQRHSAASSADDGASTNSSRRGSAESFTIPPKPQLPRAGSNLKHAKAGIDVLDHQDNAVDTAKGATTTETSPALAMSLPFDDAGPSWTLRTKGLRENRDR